LFRHRCHQLFQALDFVREFVPVPMPIAVCDEPLDCGSRKIGDAAGTFLLAHTDELTKLVF
jgi:hypothetical protein